MNNYARENTTMTVNPFAAPAPVTGVQWAELLGRLLVIEPHAVETLTTTMGEGQAVRADVHVIDQPEPEMHEDVLIFPRLLAAQVKTRLGEMVLGRLEQGTAKPNQTAPWKLAEATAQDQALGGEWLRKRKSNAFAAPAPTRTTSDAGAPPF